MEFIGIFSSMVNVIAQATTNAAQDTGALNWLTTKFVAGGIFMWPILASLVIGLAFCIERMWTLSRASVNTKSFIVKVKQALNENGIEAAKDLCSNTRGPVASVFYAGF